MVKRPGSLPVKQHSADALILLFQRWPLVFWGFIWLGLFLLAWTALSGLLSPDSFRDDASVTKTPASIVALKPLELNPAEIMVDQQNSENQLGQVWLFSAILLGGAGVSLLVLTKFIRKNSAHKKLRKLAKPQVRSLTKSPPIKARVKSHINPAVKSQPTPQTSSQKKRFSSHYPFLPEQSSSPPTSSSQFSQPQLLKAQASKRMVPKRPALPEGTRQPQTIAASIAASIAFLSRAPQKARSTSKRQAPQKQMTRAVRKLPGQAQAQAQLQPRVPSGRTQRESVKPTVTIVPSEEAHPLDWDGGSLADMMDIRTRRSSLM